MEVFEMGTLCVASDFSEQNNTLNDFNLTHASINSIQNDSDAGIGALTGICVALLMNAFFALQINRLDSQRVNLRFNKLFNSKSLLRTLVLVIVILVSPLVLILLLSALFYKVICSIIIKRKDKHFVKYLDSFDVFWSLEDDSSKSIINVLGIIESDSAYDLVKNIKEKLENILPCDSNDKIFYRRNEEFGFYYWRKFSHVDIDQYVQLVEHPKENDEINLIDLQDIMSNVSNQALPYSDEGLFQILITKQRIQNVNDEKSEYGIIFRIHHAVGDGVALIEFLCKTLADENDSCLKMFTSDTCPINYSSPADLSNMMRKLCEMPLCFVDGILRQSDDNSIHGPDLSGNKIFAWTESDENLLQKVKEIKNSVEDWRFTDILAAALAYGLNVYFSKTMVNVPENVAVVLPVRFPKTAKDDGHFKLENDFSVTILDLPIRNTYKNANKIKERCDQLRRSADPLTNYLFLKLVGGVLPRQILQPLLNSSQASMVFSNMPGPDHLKLCGGNLIKKLVFFVPNKGKTGVGVTALSYGGILRLGAMADTALVPSSGDLAILLRGMQEGVNRLHDMLVK